MEFRYILLVCLRIKPRLNNKEIIKSQVSVAFLLFSKIHLNEISMNCRKLPKDFEIENYFVI